MVYLLSRASLVAQMVKSLPAMPETQVQSLGWEDALEKEKASRSSMLAWDMPRMEGAGRLQTMGSQKVRHDWATTLLPALQSPPGRKLGLFAIILERECPQLR